MNRLFFALTIITLLFSCAPEENNNDESGGNNSPTASVSVTVNANHISAISAILSGKANLGSTVASDLQIGFQYSMSAGILPSNSVTVEATDADANYNYTTSITGLKPATKYYFRSFIRQNGQDTYGETQEFMTKNVASFLETKDASEIEATKATLNAKLDLTDIQYTSLAYGFLLGTSEPNLIADYKCTEISNNTISAPLTNLSHKTQYWYKVYVKIDSLSFYGEVKTFTTDIVPVDSVFLDKMEYTFHAIGNSLTLNATILPADATDKSVTWSSDKEDVATVDDNGIITARDNGTATITVTTKEQSKTASCYVTIAQWVTDISIDNTSISLNEGEEKTLVATISPDNAVNKSVNWTSSDTLVAKVSNDGKLIGLSKGNAIIKVEAKDGSGQCATCSVEVTRRVSSIQLNKTYLSIYMGQSEALTATVIPEDATDKSLKWESNNEDVASVDNSGIVSAKSKGNAVITVICKSDPSIKASATIDVQEAFTSIEVIYPNSESPSYVSPDGFFGMSVGETLQISALGYPKNAGDKISFRSSDPSVLSVSEDGLVTFIKYCAETVTVYVGSQTGAAEEKKLMFKVWDQPTGVILKIINADAMTLKSGAGRPSQYIGVGCTQTFTCSVSPATAKQSVLLQSWTALFTCSMEGSTLTVKAKDSVVPSTVAEKTEGVVRLFSGGKEFAIPFIVSKYDPYQPKPGDGLYDSGTSSDRLRVIDGGWRGNDIFENSISDPSKKSKVFAMVGHIGKEWLTEDPDVTVSSTGRFRWNGIVEAADGYQRGIGIPVNASYVYASKHSAGMPFCEANANLGASYSLLGFPGLDNLKHTAYSNRQSLAAWNDAYSGNSWRYQITPFFYCDSRSNGSDGWFYGATSTTALNAKAPLECSSKTCSGWIMPTAADLFSIFNGRVPGLNEYDQEVSSTMHFLMIIMGSTDLCNEGKNRIAAFKKSAKFFSGETLDYSHWLWCSQQYDTNNGLLVIAPDSGQTQMKFDPKSNASGNYVLPIIYF